MLTDNAVERITKGETPQAPLLQVLKTKQINNAKRWKVDLSDGRYVLNGMLAAQNANLIEDGTIQEGVIIALDQYVCNEINGRYVVIILDCRAQGKHQIIGNPVPWGQASAAPGGQQQQLPQGHMQMQQQKPQLLRPNAGPVRQYGGQQQQDNGPTPMQLSSPQQPPRVQVKPEPMQNHFGGRGPVAQQQQMSTGDGSERILPIRGVNPYQNRWTIKARVLNKTDIRKWDKGPNNKGQLFSVTLMDNEGTEIRATFFREGVDMFYDMLVEDNVYTFSGGRAKLANKDFSRVNNDFELTFDNKSIIHHIPNDSSIQAVHIQRTKINAIADLPPNAMCDVIGVCLEVGDVVEFTSKAGKPLTKLETVLVDESGSSIRVTLWGERAREFKAKSQEISNPILAVKNARVSDWGGRTLGTVGGSQMLVEPELPETTELRKWFETGGSNNVAVSLSGSGGSMGGSMAPKSIFERHTISSIKHLGVGNNPKGDYAEVKATISLIPSEKMWYYACPVEGNNKKVTKNVDGSWTCESTQEQFNSKENRYIMRFALADHTGAQFCMCFNDQAIKVIGKSADEMELIKDSNEAQFSRIIHDATFQTFLFKMRIKEEEYNGEKRIKCTVQSLAPIDWAQESRELIKAIEKYN